MVWAAYRVWRGDGKRRRPQGAAVRARRSDGRSAARSQGPHPAAGDDKPKKAAPSARSMTTKTTTDEPPPRERKPRESQSAQAARKRRAKRASVSARLFYWGVVLGLWGAIAVVGVVVWAGAHLPPIQSLEIPKRPPTIEIVGIDGSMLAQRGEMAGANVALKDLPPYLPKAFIAIEDRRFYSHFGVDPIGIARAAVDQHPASRRVAGRLDPDPAARQEPVPDPGAHLCAQAAGGRARAVAGAQTFQERDPRALSQPRLFRLRRLWRRGRGATLFRQVGEERHARGSRDAGRPRQIAVAPCAEPQPGRRGEARADRARGDGGRQVHHRRAGAGVDRPSRRSP